MTETPVEEQAVEVASTAAPVVVNCRWCGEPHEQVEAEDDWACPVCDHYQGSMICPTCGQLASTAALPADQVPDPVPPKEAS